MKPDDVSCLFHCEAQQGSLDRESIFLSADTGSSPSDIVKFRCQGDSRSYILLIIYAVIIVKYKAQAAAEEVELGVTAVSKAGCDQYSRRTATDYVYGARRPVEVRVQT